MKLKTSAVFIIVGAIASLCYSISNILEIFFTSQSSYLQGSFLFVIQRIPFIITTVALILIGFQFYRPAERRKLTVPAILLACGAGISTLMLIYLFRDSQFRGDMRNTINISIITLTPMMLATAGILLSLKVKNFKFIAWMFFLVGSFWLLREWVQPLYWFIMDSRSTLTEFWDPILSLIGMMLSIGLITISQTLSDSSERNQLTENEEEEIAYSSEDIIDSSYREVEKNNVLSQYKDSNSVIFWLITFVIAMIPLVGIAFLIYWSVSKVQVKRGNWAVANVIMSTVSTLFFIMFIGSGISEFIPSRFIGAVLIIVIVFFGTATGICAYFNSRNQENIALENHTYSPVVMGWIGYSLLMAVPLVNIICLIVFAAEGQNKYRQKWAQARLLFIPFTYMFYFFLFENQLFKEVFGDFGRLLSRITFN